MSNYDPRAEYLARQAKLAQEAEQVSQEDGHVDAGNIETESAQGEVDATKDASAHTGEEVEVASSEGALSDTETKIKQAEDHATVVDGTPTDASRKEVDATKDAEAGGKATEIASNEEITKLPEQTEGSENVAETEGSPSEISTDEPEIATDAKTDAPAESPVEPYSSSQSPESLAQGVVSDVKKIETGVTQVLNEDRAIGELENVAAEMRAIIAEKGAMTSAESMIVAIATQNALRGIDAGAVDMASLESFAVPEVAGIATEVSLEGVMDKIDNLATKSQDNLAQGFKNLVGLANSLTPLLSRLKKRAEAIRGQVNNSNREAGLKTIDDEDIAITLSVDGKTPNAETTIKTLKYMNVVAAELFSDNTWKLAEENGKLAAQAVAEVASTTDFTAAKPSYWWLFLGGTIGTIVYGVKDGKANAKASSEIKVDTSKLPTFAKAFPAIAKLNHADTDTLTVRRSAPLFGNTAIIVSDYKPQVMATAASKAKPGITLEHLTEHKGSAEIQALTSAQQKVVLDETITIIDRLIGYYGSYTKRSAAVARVYESAFAAGKAAQSEGNKANVYIPLIVRRMAGLVTDGVFANLGKIARDFSVTADGLIDYVEQSRKASQADDADPAKADENRVEAEAKS